MRGGFRSQTAAIQTQRRKFYLNNPGFRHSGRLHCFPLFVLQRRLAWAADHAVNHREKRVKQ